MKDKSPFRLAPGQSRSLPFNITLCHGSAEDVLFEITYKLDHSPRVFRTSRARQSVQRQEADEPQKITYLHPGGVVSYAMLRSPSGKATRHADPNTSFAVLIDLHGAGVKVDSNLIRNSFRDAPNLKAWILFPSGVTSWSGDDWRKPTQRIFLRMILLTSS